MKKWRNLFDKITDLDNIILAHNKARKNKTSRADVRMVDKDVVSYCKQIQQMLINETYVTSEYHLFIKSYCSTQNDLNNFNSIIVISKTFKQYYYETVLDDNKPRRN